MSIRPSVVLALFAAELSFVLLGTVPTRAEDVSSLNCPQLWYRKNALLKSKGLCFRDPHAARTFGNNGCTTDDQVRVSLTPPEQELMARIVLAEKIKLCR